MGEYNFKLSSNLTDQYGIPLVRDMLLRIKLTVYFAISVLILALVSAFILILTLKPSTFLNPAVLVLVSLVLLIGAAFLTYLGNKREWKTSKFQAIRKLSRKKLAILLSTILIAFLSLILIPKYISHVQEQRLLEPAEQQFVVLMTSELSERQIQNTLIQLQKSLTKLRDKYSIQPLDYAIPVYLYKDTNELRKHNQSADWTSAYVIFNTGEPPKLFIPVEEGGGFWTKTAPTPTPAHEMTHVAVYESMKLKAMSLIPTSFHEGLAQYESLNSPQNILDRFLIRLSLLWQRNLLSNRDSIPDYYSTESNEDVRNFYNISYEYIRYLAVTSGEDKLWHVVQLVGNNVSFDNAFITIFGKSYSEFYHEFIEYYY